ncbi:MAG TPA: hypothetical protein VFG46_03540 [Chryseolinea sp.]|nr:hypothetical protein [Chryseolinea sp.]
MWFEKNNSSFFKDLQAKPFELQVWFVVMAIAGLRTLKSVVQHVASSKINPTGLVIDVSILLIFCGLAVLIYFRKIPRVPLIVGVILLILLIFSYVQFGGVMGTTEFNLMGLGVLFALAYNRKELAVVMALYIVLILVANVDLRFNGWLTRSFYKGVSTSLDNYLTTLLTLLLIIIYFKKALTQESNRITELRKRLSEQMKTIVSQKKELEVKKQFLHEANARLEEEIRNHSHEIVRQNNAMKDYIWLSTESLQMPLKRISARVTDLRENSILETILKEQVGELNGVVENLKRDLTQHQSTPK